VTGLHAARDQIRGARIERRAHVRRERLDRADPLPVADDDAAHRVAVAARVLRQAMDVVVDRIWPWLCRPANVLSSTVVTSCSRASVVMRSMSAILGHDAGLRAPRGRLARRASERG